MRQETVRIKFTEVGLVAVGRTEFQRIEAAKERFDRGESIVAASRAEGVEVQAVEALIRASRREDPIAASPTRVAAQGKAAMWLLQHQTGCGRSLCRDEWRQRPEPAIRPSLRPVTAVARKLPYATFMMLACAMLNGCSAMSALCCRHMAVPTHRRHRPPQTRRPKTVVHFACIRRRWARTWLPIRDAAAACCCLGALHAGNKPA